jgi:hypothetical protein
MSIASIAGSTLSGIGSAAAGAVRAGSGSFAAMFENARNSTSAAVNSARSAIGSTELTRKAEATFSEFKRNMTQLLSDAGVDDSFELSLSSDGMGGISVNADHPDKEKIEQLLRENPDLVANFAELVAAYQEVRSSSDPSGNNDPAEGALRVSFLDGQASLNFE